MTAFYVGDVPAEDLVIEPARGGYGIDLTPFDSASVTFRGPYGDTIESSGFLAEIDGTTVVVEWPGETVLDEPGPYELTLILESSSGYRETVNGIRIIVQDPANGWYTLDTARDDWQDAPDSDAVLFELLEVAKDAVMEYAPETDPDVLPSLNYRKAQLMQARNIWNVDKGDAGDGSMGLNGFVITPKPLDWHVKQLLRPRRVIGFAV